MRKSLMLLVTAVAVSTGNAEGQATWDSVKDFLNVCLGSSLRPCGSVIVKTRVVGGTTMVEMMVRNEQGSIDFDQTGGSFLSAIGLTAPFVGGIVSELGVTTTGSVGRVGLPEIYWNPADNGLGGQIEFGAASGPGKQGGIRGCDDALGTTADFFITCNDPDNPDPELGGHTGWVVFSFTTSEMWSADDAEIVLKYQSIHGDYIEGEGEGEGEVEDLSLICRTDSEDVEHACAVVPEPSTWALLLTGMVGVLGMGWLRRKQEDAA